MAKRKRRKLKPLPKIILLIIAFSIVFGIVYKCVKPFIKTNPEESVTSSAVSNVESKEDKNTQEQQKLKAEVDKWYLFLVNDKNPLPDDYNYESNLATLDDKYINGSLKQVDKRIKKPLINMINAAREDGVWLAVWSPYRSYDIQKMLFQRQTNNLIAEGVPESEAEDKAATMVARPGTSEHHTGFAVDINMASDEFKNTEQFRWLKKHAAEYGFVMRYAAEKQDITGVIYESWHWRYVTPEHAKKMNELGMCLEEYLEYLKNGGEE